MSSQVQDETVLSGRQRRSAATKNKAWSTLMSTGTKHKGEDPDEEDVSSEAQSTPRSGPRKKTKIEAPKSKAESVSPPKPIQEKKTPPIPAQAPRLYPSSTDAKSKGPIENGSKSTAALGKEQIENIEKEMIKTYMSNESDDFSASDDGNDSFQEDLLDEDDEEFTIKPKRSYTKRAATSIRGRGRGAPVRSQPFNPRSGGFPVQNMMASREGPPSNNSRVIVRPPTLRYASSAAVSIYENRPIKTVLLRKPIDSLNNNGSGPRMPMTISSMSVQTTKQIEEINKKFGDRVIKGDSVQKFNDLIELLVNELKLMAEDRERMVRNHQELTEQMNLSHSTILDIKDSRIRQLENTVGKLQTQISQLVTNMQSSYSQHESSEKPTTAEDDSKEEEERDNEEEDNEEEKKE